MNEFLVSLKADLLQRRMLPLLGFVVACLVGAIAYAMLGGGSSGSTPTASTSTPAVTQGSGLSVSSTTPNTAVAETTDGVSEQHNGKARNPFTPLGGSSSSSSSSASSSTSSSSSSSSSSGSSSPKTTGGSPASPSPSTTKSSTPSTPTPTATPPAKKSTPVYDVVVKFGTVPAGTSASSVSLPKYENLKLQAPLPSSKEVLLVFRGVSDKGRSATFTLVGEAILTGQGSCLPSATQCQAVDLQAGETEQLQYVQPSGQMLDYVLEVVSITPLKASTASAASRGWAESKAGAEVLRAKGLETLPYLHYSSAAPGVLVFGWHKPFAAGASTRAH
jgi:hypothetical protein